ncbi:putative germin-like protein 2-3 [Gracilariopsis chorda]|uniref:Putative germin-like protein 2-3 n=1 Tax=Gracilariopsis chorda TaxID=448386 RepID=A0A2V3IXN5_9FLOR|nr:putative germin-like protein 2-3 [Gracilariopsis chorda]|eukprot:PXF46457.1 putative germin-like protein 2-3 [Gracilariopsis chorda]
MKSIIALTALTLAVFVNQAAASIPSFGLQSAAGIRSGLQDSDFRINPSKGQIINTPGFTVQIANVADFPALGGQDVQSQIVRVLVRAGQPFIPHYHPRGTETLNALAGVFRVSFLSEGLSPRNVTNILHPGDSTVFPQGLPHETVCISKMDCLFLSVFNSADPGLVPVTL